MSASKRRTDRDIRESLIRLLEEKPLHRITVQDLCHEAEINRTTFYRYYEDIYALYDAVTQGFFRQLFVDISKKYSSEKSDAVRLRRSVEEALDLIEKRKNLCRILFNDTDRVFAFRLLQEIQKIAAQEHPETDSLRRMRISYMCGGILTVILEWIRNDCTPDKKDVASVIEVGVHQAFI